MLGSFTFCIVLPAMWFGQVVTSSSQSLKTDNVSARGLNKPPPPSYHGERYLPAGSACSLGTALLPVSRPTSLLLYRTDSSVSTILEGSSCFMLFHQSAAKKKQKTTHIRLHRQSSRDPHKPVGLSDECRTCAIPVREVVRSLGALFPLSKRKKNIQLWPTKFVLNKYLSVPVWSGERIPAFAVPSADHDQDESRQDHDHNGHKNGCERHV